MIDIKSPLKGVRDRERLAALGASFVAKVKATKVVWFPPAPLEAGEKVASTTTKATKKASAKATGAAERTAAKATGAAERTTAKTPGAAKKATKKTTGAAKKATTGVKGVTSPPRRKKTGS